MSSALATQFAGFARGNTAAFPNPFMDLASLAMPTSFRSLLYWAEFLWDYHGAYRMAHQRINSYFITDVVFDSTSEDERENWNDFALKELNLLGVLRQMADNRAAYGNDYVSIIVPVRRYLTCPKCALRLSLDTIYDNKSTFNFSWEFSRDNPFVASCPSCKTTRGYRGSWTVTDERREEELTVKHWSVHEIELLHDYFTGKTDYLWRIPEHYRQQVASGHLHAIQTVDLTVLEAIQNRQMYRFDRDAIYHLKEPTLSGRVNRGYGFPRVLANFRQLWHVQVLHRANESICSDYVVPFRVISPAPRPGAGGGGAGGMGRIQDPLGGTDSLKFRSYVNRMIAAQRRDPSSIHVSPYPMQFQMFGADAAKLAPRDLLDQAYERLLNDIGTPVELYNGSLQLQVAPVALRLFESTHQPLVSDLNRALRWLVQEIARIRKWETVEAYLKRVTIADNLEKQMMASQLMMSQMLSGTTVLRDLGYDWEGEQRRLAQEARIQARLQARTQKEMEQSGFAEQIAAGQIPGQQPAQGDPAGGQGGAPAQGQDPNAMGGAMGTSMQGPVTQYLMAMSGDVPQTPQDMLAAADSLAEQLLGMPESAKDSELIKLKKAKPHLHAMVKEKLAEKRRNAKNMAYAAMQQQQKTAVRRLVVRKAPADDLV